MVTMAGTMLPIVKGRAVATVNILALVDDGAKVQPPTSPAAASEAEACHWWRRSDQAHASGKRCGHAER
jgi:hypothetical protein